MKTISISILALLFFVQAGDAQRSTAVRTTRIEDMQNYSHTFFIDLKVGNKMRIDVYDRYGPAMHYNIDSLMNIAVQCYERIKDSLADDYYARTMDINLYDTVLRSIGWGAMPPKERRMLVYDSTQNIVKFMQDTVFIKLYSVMPRIGEHFPPFLKITLTLNSVAEIENFNTGRYNVMLADLDPYNNKQWSIGANGRRWLKENSSIQIIRAYDETKLQRRMGHYISFSAQNYRAHFVPSVSAGFGMITEQNFIREEIFAGYEMAFTFEKGADGREASFANHFITLSYKTSNLNVSRNHIIGVFPNLKLSYLIIRKGTVMDKHSFRIGVAQFTVGKGDLKIEPSFYFKNLFREVSPSFRITQSF